MINPVLKHALVSAARTIQSKAYAPYSNYFVGAAILDEDDAIHTGVNVENASYGLTICAERTAVTKMVSRGARRIKAVAVCGEEGVTPCGACRQVLAEFIDEDVPVYLVSSGSLRETTLLTLLPMHFGPKHLADR
ncbi:MAG: cytidine deaminase [Candidatus Promineifilaceae bacterium]